MNETERVQFIIDRFEAGSARAFADRIGVSESSVSKLRKGKFRISSFAVAIARNYPLINCRWLLTGDGNPVVQEATRDEITAKLDTLIELIR